MESEELCVLILTNFASFTNISNISSWLQKFHFSIGVVLNSLQTQKGSGTSFQVSVFGEFFNNWFSFVIWNKLAKFH